MPWVCTGRPGPDDRGDPVRSTTSAGSSSSVKGDRVVSAAAVAREGHDAAGGRTSHDTIGRGEGTDQARPARCTTGSISSLNVHYASYLTEMNDIENHCTLSLAPPTDHVHFTLEVAVRPGEYIQWHDLFVIVDDGSIPLARCRVIEDAMMEQAKQYPSGIGLVGILPPGAKPPAPEVQKAVKETLMRLGPSMTCLGYVVEGTGFKAVAARATLIGMKIFSSRPYPIYVDISLREVLLKVLPHLPKGKTVTSDVNVIMKVIAEHREKRKAFSATPSLRAP